MRGSFILTVPVFCIIQARYPANRHPYRPNYHRPSPNYIHQSRKYQHSPPNYARSSPKKTPQNVRPLGPRLSDQMYRKHNRNDGATLIKEKSNKMSRNHEMSPMSRQLTIDLPKEERTYTSSRPEVYSNFFETGDLKSTKVRVSKKNEEMKKDVGKLKTKKMEAYKGK
jgi:hypothetical protein